MKANGKVIKYGDNIDTDVIIPARYLNTTDHKELASHCMEDIDKEFVNKVKDGDIMVGGANFGCGSSREHAPIAIKASGISCVIAKDFARIFYRNAINIGLPILECAEASEDIDEGNEVEVDFDTGAKVEEPVKSTGTKVEDSVFHIAEYIPKALRDLMYPNLVSEEELMEAVYQRGFFPKGTPFQNLPQEFVDGCLIGAWPQVLDVIKTMRSHYDIPFDK